METRRLGKSDLEPTRVVLGAWAIGGAFWGGQEKARSIEAIHASLDAGVNMIDTAPAYGFGRSEEIVGEALRGRAEQPLIATKCGLRWDRDDGEHKMDVVTEDGRRTPVWYNLRPDSIREECEASLRRLGVERIDLYQIHWPDPRHPLEDALEALVALRDDGKVRDVGVSNFSVPQLETSLRGAGIVSDQPQYSLLDRHIEAEILPWCREHDVGVIAYSPMGRGLLTGKIGPDVEFPPSDHRSSVPWFARERRARVLSGLERLRPIAASHGISLANLAVAWVLGEPGVTAALVGARSAEQATENARAAAVRLSADERREIAEALSAVM